MSESYFVYSQHKTMDAAERALEGYYANGEICEAERPYIETRRRPPFTRENARHTKLYPTAYCVMFPG